MFASSRRYNLLTEDPQKRWDRTNRPVDPKTVGGKPKLAKYAIACRYRFRGLQWDNSDPVLIDARRKYDAGTHLMCQESIGEFAVLYLVPRKYPVRLRKPYFRRATF